MICWICKSDKSLLSVSIALVGYRATGKTTVGRIMARQLGWTFVDMDELLVKRLGMTINDWVRLYGWNAFRDEETKLLKELSGEKHIVVATGGGAVERAENRNMLKENFIVVWLYCPLEEIVNRLKKDEKSSDYRPSLTGLGLIEEVSHVLSLREPLYREVAHIAVDVSNKSPEIISGNILKAFCS